MASLRITILAFLLITSVSCQYLHPGSFKGPEDTKDWSSNDPLSMPLSVRLLEFNKGNMAPNPSFEKGRLNSVDPDNPYYIEHWEALGTDVMWVNTTSPGYGPDEVSHGIHAIKVSRDTASELDEPEGIISDFIPVIPGNYRFFFDVKLKRIRPVSRSTKLNDTIVARLYFYNGKKEEISGAVFNPSQNKFLDNSNKSYAFANFWEIEEFPWGRVRGGRYHHPFSEGDYPDDARFVRIFFGLKGKGTIWIDNVELKYSKWNFSALERMEKYFDRPLSVKDRIIPSPKQIHCFDDFFYFNSKNRHDEKPVILLPDAPETQESLAAGLLKARLDSTFNEILTEPKHQERPIPILHGDAGFNDLPESGLIFSVGRTRLFYQKQGLLPLHRIEGHEQGYILKSYRDKDRMIVFLVGNKPIGTYYAATTAVQLLEKERFIYHDAEVVDYPDFLGRSYPFSSWKSESELEHDLKSMTRMSAYKFNKAYVGYRQGKGNKDWYNPRELYVKGVKRSATFCRDTGIMDLAIMINPYYHFDFEMPEKELGDKRYLWTHGDPSSLEMLKNAFRIGLDHGAKTIMLASDDFVPHEGKWRKNYAPYTEADKKRFVNLQNAQAHVINQLHDWVQANYPGTRFEFCPPWYNNLYIDITPGRAEIYFRELVSQIPDDIAIIWTGPTIRSLSIDMIDIYRYAGLIGRYPMLWDNTLYARGLETKVYGYYACYYPGKVRMSNLFEPYDIYLPAEFQNYNHSRHMYMNGSASSETFKIKYMTVADYEWNTKAYDPEFSLWKALVTAFGPTNAKTLLYFNDAYYGLYDMCMRMERDGENERYITMGDDFISKLRHHYHELGITLSENKRLLKELESKMKRQLRRYNNLVRTRKN